MGKSGSKMRRLIWAAFFGMMVNGIGVVWADTIRSDRFSENPLKLKVPGQEATENAQATEQAQAAQTKNATLENAAPAAVAPVAALDAGQAAAEDGPSGVVQSTKEASAEEASKDSSSVETAEEPESPTALNLDDEGPSTLEGRQLEAALDAQPTIVVPSLPPETPTPFRTAEDGLPAMAAGGGGAMAAGAGSEVAPPAEGVSAQRAELSSSSSPPSSSSSSSSSSPASSSSSSSTDESFKTPEKVDINQVSTINSDANSATNLDVKSDAPAVVSPANALAGEAVDEFDQGVAQYKKTPDYIKSAMLEKSRFLFMSGNDNFLHGGFVALVGEKHASSGDDFGRTLSLEAQYFYQVSYAEWHFSLETVGITQHKRNIWGEPCYRDGRPIQYFMERDRVVVDIRRRHQYGTVYWLGGLLLEYWTDRGFLAKPVQKFWHKTFERQGATQYITLDRGVDQTAFGTRSGLGVKELWNTAAYWDNILQVEMVLEQMFSYKRRGSIGWTGEYTMTTGTWLNRNLSNPALSLQFWGTYRRLFGGADESQGGVNLIYGFATNPQDKKVWRVLLGVNFNREWEDRYFGKYDKDHAFWYLGLDVLSFE